MVIYGVDTDTKGALAAICTERKHILFFDLPREQYNTKDSTINRINPVLLAKGIVNLHNLGYSPDRVWLEEQRGLPDQSSVHTFNFGGTFWSINAGITAVSVAKEKEHTTHLVHSTVWKAAYNITANKEDNLKVAKKMFSSLPFDKICKFKYNITRAEALLIATYGLVMEQKNNNIRIPGNYFEDFTWHQH